MKTIEITVNVPEKGKTIGTTAWVAEQLENMELQFGNTKNNEPCLLYRFTKEGEWSVLAFAQTGNNLAAEMYYDSYRGLFIVYAIDDMHINGMFNYLTDAAEIKVTEFIKLCADELKEFLDSEGNVIGEW